MATSLEKNRLTWAVHISVVALVLLWLFPTSACSCRPSARRPDPASGWWASMFPAEQNETFRTATR
jgi:alpha-glucoside transport system permease protein